jgi:hypothetical protein
LDTIIVGIVFLIFFLDPLLVRVWKHNWFIVLILNL